MKRGMRHRIAAFFFFFSHTVTPVYLCMTLIIVLKHSLCCMNILRLFLMALGMWSLCIWKIQHWWFQDGWDPTVDFAMVFFPALSTAQPSVMLKEMFSLLTLVQIWYFVRNNTIPVCMAVGVCLKGCCGYTLVYGGDIGVIVSLKLVFYKKKKNPSFFGKHSWKFLISNIYINLECFMELFPARLSWLFQGWPSSNISQISRSEWERAAQPKNLPRLGFRIDAEIGACRCGP